MSGGPRTASATAAAGGGTRPTSARADLLALVGGDLAGCRLERRSGSVADVTGPDGERFALEVRQERRRLITLQTSVAQLEGPPADAAVSVVLHHTGQLRRTGLRARVKGGDRRAGEVMRDRLLLDGELERVSLALDFTRFVVAPHAGVWRATIELMGGSHVRTALPPSSSYVRLATDQVAALLGTIAVLRRRLPAVDPTPAPVAGSPGAAADPDDHLPRRLR